MSHLSCAFVLLLLTVRLVAFDAVQVVDIRRVVLESAVPNHDPVRSPRPALKAVLRFVAPMLQGACRCAVCAPGLHRCVGSARLT